MRRSSSSAANSPSSLLVTSVRPRCASIHSSTLMSSARHRGESTAFLARSSASPRLSANCFAMALPPRRGVISRATGPIFSSRKTWSSRAWQARFVNHLSSVLIFSVFAVGQCLRKQRDGRAQAAQAYAHLMHAFRIKVTDGIGVSGKMAKGGAGDRLETLDGGHSLLKLDRFGETRLERSCR